VGIADAEVGGYNSPMDAVYQLTEAQTRGRFRVALLYALVGAALALTSLLAAGCAGSTGNDTGADEQAGAGGSTAADNLRMADADASIQELIADFDGVVSLYAKNLDTGQEFALRADEPVRTASTIKLPIMVACYRAVAEGKASWQEQIPLTDASRVSGSGVIREFAPGTRLTLRDLMHVMIVVSDNTATNLVLDRVGADYVNETMAQLGFAQTRSMRKIRGDGADLKAASGWSREGAKEENRRFGIGRSTPREMARLLEMIAAGDVVSAEASKEMLAVLERQQYKDGIGRSLVDVPGIRVASKSGALDALRSDVGIVFHPRGRLVIAVTVDSMPVTDYSPDNKGNLLISRLSRELLKSLLPGD
jgi:beta-lactamase class A